MKSFEKVQEKVSGWIGLGTIEESQLRQLIWALAMDPELETDLIRAVAEERAEYERELEMKENFEIEN
jgi:hypothetical protein